LKKIISLLKKVFEFFVTLEKLEKCSKVLDVIKREFKNAFYKRDLDGLSFLFSIVIVLSRDFFEKFKYCFKVLFIFHSFDIELADFINIIPDINNNVRCKKIVKFIVREEQDFK
jgi:hypothetical protein